MSKLTKVEGIKKLAKDGATVGGVSIAYILVMIAQSQGIPISESEAVLLSGILSGIGSKIRELFGD